MLKRHLLLGLVATFLAGCQDGGPARPIVSAPPPAAHVSPALELKAEGDALVGRAEHRAAVEKYQRAAQLDPDDMSVRFALGTAYTFLDDRRGAVDAFRVVARRADPGSIERREARRWLVAAGEPLPADPSVSTAAQTPAQPAPKSTEPERITGGRLVGRTEWPGVDPTTRRVRGELWIHGAEPLTETTKRSRPLSLGGTYHFYDIPPGKYRIFAQMYSAPKDVILWDQRVTVEDGKITELVLTPATALQPPDKFPPPPQS